MEKLSENEIAELIYPTINIKSWNCHYGFKEEKAKAIKWYNTDILVIQECREIDMERSGYDVNHRDWYGDHKEAMDLPDNVKADRDLGIGIFWKDGIHIEKLQVWKDGLCHKNDFRYLVPYKVRGDFEPFILIAVWTKNKMDAGDPLDYIQKAHAAVDHYKNIGLLDGRVVLIGDFNSNSIWDKYYRKGWSHSAFVDKLEKMGIKDCSPGEKRGTYYYIRNNKDNYVTNDYCFASAQMGKPISFYILGFNEWKTNENGVKRWHGSDHLPINVIFNIDEQKQEQEKCNIGNSHEQ